MENLAVPAEVTADEKARELLRVWAAGVRQYITIATGVWNDPAAWGIVLVDLARNIASAYQENEKKDIAVTLSRIKLI